MVYWLGDPQSGRIHGPSGGRGRAPRRRQERRRPRHGRNAPTRKPNSTVYYPTTHTKLTQHGQEDQPPSLSTGLDTAIEEVIERWKQIEEEKRVEPERAEEEGSGSEDDSDGDENDREPLDLA